MFAHRAPSLHHHHWKQARPPLQPPNQSSRQKSSLFTGQVLGTAVSHIAFRTGGGTTLASVTVIGLSTQVTTATASVCRLMPRGEVSCDSQQSSPWQTYPIFDHIGKGEKVSPLRVREVRDRLTNGCTAFRGPIFLFFFFPPPSFTPNFLVYPSTVYE
jgi:hypothetical protein